MILTCIFFHCSMCISMHLHLQVETEILKGVAGLLLLSALNSYLTPHFLLPIRGASQFSAIFVEFTMQSVKITLKSRAHSSQNWMMGKLEPETPINLMVEPMVSGEDFPVKTNPSFILGCSQVFSQRPEKGHDLHDFSPAKPGALERSQVRFGRSGAKTPDFHGVWTFLVRLKRRGCWMGWEWGCWDWWHYECDDLSQVLGVNPV